MTRAVGTPSHRTRLIVFAMMAILLATFAPATASAAADVEDFTFESLEVDYVLSRADDGTSRLHVTETYVAVFPERDQNRGMRRTIPDEYLGSPLRPRLISITDGDGAARAEETASDDGWFSMTSRARDYVHGRQTYVFTYELENVTRFFADTRADEFYWNVNGTMWAQPFGRVTARLTLDPALAGAATGAASCYVGRQGSSDTCRIETDAAAGGIVATAGPLDPRETMTIAVAFDEGTFSAFDASYLASPWGWLQGIAGLGVVGALVGAGVVRGRRLRDDPGRPTIIAEYTPPPGIDALESAVLLHRTSKAIPAEVLEQAVVGSIRIVEGESRRFTGRAPLTAELVDPSRADGDGLMLLHGLFPDGEPGDTFEFGRSDTRFSTAAQGIIAAATKQLTARGLWRGVSPSRYFAVLGAIAATVLVFAFGFVALDGGVDGAVPITLMVASGLAVLVTVVLVSRKPLTSAGAEARDHLRGLQQFIEWAEADRIRMLQSPAGAERVAVDTQDPRQMLKLYETLLPYAVVFGQEKEWAQQLAVLYGDGHSPGWYAGTSGFNAASFSAGISTLSASTASSSSTSGGSSGGGSAGGGGGGGGGGGV